MPVLDGGVHQAYCPDLDAGLRRLSLRHEHSPLIHHHPFAVMQNPAHTNLGAGEWLAPGRFHGVIKDIADCDGHSAPDVLSL